ncbi:MAG: GNAT family N-acetyltransferase [Flavobacteriales bacterium]|nr:GNAT family N-acetyltransferase [Flavobacteriales bacterium]
MPDVRIVIAGLTDLGTIASIARRTWPVAYGTILSPKQLAYMLDLFYSEPALNLQFTQGQRFLLATTDRTTVGFAGFEPHYLGGSTTRLHKLYVLPQQQGTGAGRALLKAVIEKARASGDERLELNVNKYNTAQQWYKRQGFHTVRAEVIDIGQGYVMDDFVMELAL